MNAAPAMACPPIVLAAPWGRHVPMVREPGIAVRAS